MAKNRRVNSFHLLLIIPLLSPLLGCRSAAEGDLLVTGEIADTRAFESVTSVRYLVVSNSSLTDLTAFHNLREATGVTVQGNDRLVSLRGLEGLRRVEGIVIAENASLRSLDGLDGLSRAGELVVAGNLALSSLEALDGLEAVGELDVSLDTNPSLLATEVERLRARTSREIALGR